MRYVQRNKRLKEFRESRCAHGGFEKGADHYVLTSNSMVY